MTTHIMQSVCKPHCYKICKIRCTFSVSLELLASFLSGGIFSTIRNSVLQPQLFNTDTIMENMSKVLTCLETLTDQSTENF